MMTNKQKTVSGKYVLIPRVLILPFDKQRRVLLIKGDSTKRIWADKWNGPGGHVEIGESPVEAAKRELLEESGLQAQKWSLFAELMIDTGKEQGIAVWVFIAEETQGELIPSSEGEPKWLTIEEALQCDLVEDLFTLLPLAAHFEHTDKLLWGKYSYDNADQLIMRLSH